tara:strand:- start:1467 stop:2378 length:912 start_codon:yes stop_codon:yes gene_type:complete
MEWSGRAKQWRIEGISGSNQFDGKQIMFPVGMDSDVLMNVLTRQNPTLRIILQARKLDFEYELIGVVESTSGASSYGIYIAAGMPPHQAHVCVELMTPAEAVRSNADAFWQFRHALLNQIVHRVACAVFSDISASDFDAYGVFPDGEFSSKAFPIGNDLDWCRLKRDAFDGSIWTGSIHCPRGIAIAHQFDIGGPAFARSELYDACIYTDTSDLPNEADTEVYDEDADSVIPKRWATVKPMWQEHTPIVYYNRNQRNQFWIEETRCKTCGQRIIVHLNKAQCPEGTPDTTIRCSACKSDFQFH